MRFLSLFAGIGGFDLGLERAGMECVGQVEIDPYCQAVLKKHWPHVKRMGDIREVKGDEFGSVDLVCGGFPCQPFSKAGRRKGQADDRFLWPEMLRVIESVRPSWVVGENVAGIISLGLDQVLADLEDKEYSCQPVTIPACALGAPHRRERVWILAHRNGGSRSAQHGEQQKEWPSIASSSCCGNVAHSGIPRLPDGDARQDSQGSYPEFNGEGSGYNWHTWATEPGVGRVAHGVSRRVDRLKCLGNSVVPQVVEEIGKAIMNQERAKSQHITSRYMVSGCQSATQMAGK